MSRNLECWFSLLMHCLVCQEKKLLELVTETLCMVIFFFGDQTAVDEHVASYEMPGQRMPKVSIKLVL